MDPRERATADALADPHGFGTFRKVALTRARKMEKPFTVETPHGTVDGKSVIGRCDSSFVEIYNEWERRSKDTTGPLQAQSGGQS